MSKMIDATCNVEFPSEASYLKHKKAGHSVGTLNGTPIEAPPTPEPPPGIPQEALPTQEFIDQVQRIEQGDENATETSVPSQHPSEMPASIPISLTYKYLGECPEHRQPVLTLEADIMDKHFALAVCPACGKQLDTREVNKL